MRVLPLIALAWDSVAAQSNPLWPPEEGIQLACSISYQAARSATIGGECSQHTCTAACQAIIAEMLRSCEGQAYESVDRHGVASTRMFTEEAVRVLKLLGPQREKRFDCAYHQGHQECSEQCRSGNDSFSRALNGPLVVFPSAAMGPECAEVKTLFGISILERRGCDLGCFNLYLSYVEACSGCVDLGIRNNLNLVARAITWPSAHCSACDEPQAIADTIKQLCCVGPGNAGDSTCSPQRDERFDTETGVTHTVVWQRPDTIDPDGVCASYIAEIARACPSLFSEGGWVPLQMVDPEAVRVSGFGLPASATINPQDRTGIYMITEARCNGKPTYQREGGGDNLVIYQPDGYADVWVIGPAAQKTECMYQSWVWHNGCYHSPASCAAGTWQENNGSGWITTPGLLVSEVSDVRCAEIDKDCAGVCFGSAFEDACGQCNCASDEGATHWAGDCEVEPTCQFSVRESESESGERTLNPRQQELLVLGAVAGGCWLVGVLICCGCKKCKHAPNVCAPLFLNVFFWTFWTMGLYLNVFFWLLGFRFLAIWVGVTVCVACLRWSRHATLLTQVALPEASPPVNGHQPVGHLNLLEDGAKFIHAGFSKQRMQTHVAAHDPLCNCAQCRPAASPATTSTDEMCNPLTTVVGTADDKLKVLTTVVVTKIVPPEGNGLHR